MRSYKLTINLSNGTKVWINPQFIVKMEKTISGEYYIYLINDEKYIISQSTARQVENCMAVGDIFD